MKSTGLWKRKPTIITDLEDVKNVHFVQSQSRRLVAETLVGRFSNTASHIVDSKPSNSNIDRVTSRNESLLNSFFNKLRDIGLQKLSTFTITKDICSFFHRLDKSFIPRLKTWQDDNGLDIVHICIIADAVDVLNELFRKDFIPKTNQPAICPYAHFSTLLNRPDCLRLILKNRPDDHFKLLDPKIDKVPTCIIEIETASTNDDYILETRMTGLLTHIRNDFRATSDELNIPVEVIKRYSQIVNNSKKKIAIEGARRSTDTTLAPQSGSMGQRRKQSKKLSSVGSSSTSSIRMINVTDDGVRNGAHSHRQPDLIMKRAPKGKHKLSLHTADRDFEPSSISTVGLRITREPHIEPLTNAFLPPILPPIMETLKDHNQISATSSQGDIVQDPSEDADEWSELRRNSLFKLRSNKRLNGSYSSQVSIKEKDTDVNQNAVDSSFVRKDKIFLYETPMSIAFKKGFFKCVKIILEIIVTNQYGLNREYPLLAATEANAPLAIMVLCECDTIVFDDFQVAVSLTLRQHNVDCCKRLLSHIRFGNFRKNLLGGDNLLHVLYNGNSEKGSTLTQYLPEMTSVLIHNGESIGNTKCGQYPLYSLIVSAFNDDSGIDQTQYITTFKILLQAGADPCFKEKIQKAPNTHPKVSRDLFSSVFDCIINSAQTSRFISEENGLVQELMNRFFLEFYNHSITTTYTSTFCTPNMILFSYMAIAVKFELDIDILQVFLRLGFNPMQKHRGFYAVNYYFYLLFPYLERYEVDNCTEFYSQEVEKLMYLCRKMPLSDLKDAMLIFLDNQMVGLSCQAVFVAKYFCHLVGQMLTSPRSLRDTSALQVWHKDCKRKEKSVGKLHVSNDIKKLILP